MAVCLSVTPPDARLSLARHRPTPGVSPAPSPSLRGRAATVAQLRSGAARRPVRRGMRTHSAALRSTLGRQRTCRQMRLAYRSSMFELHRASCHQGTCGQSSRDSKHAAERRARRRPAPLVVSWRRRSLDPGNEPGLTLTRAAEETDSSSGIDVRIGRPVYATDFASAASRTQGRRDESARRQADARPGAAVGDLNPAFARMPPASARASRRSGFGSCRSPFSHCGKLVITTPQTGI